VSLQNKEGKVTITATATDGSGVKATKELDVSKNVTKLRVPLATVYLQKGKSLVLPVAADDGKYTVESALTYVSSSPAVLSVDAKGNMKAAKTVKKNTKVTVTVTAKNGVAKKVAVNVVPKAVAHKGHTVKGAPKKLEVGAIKQLSIKLKNKKATTLKVTFTSSNKKVLEVDKAGKIIAKGEGKAYVKVKVGKKTVKTKAIVVVAAVKSLSVVSKSVKLAKGKSLKIAVSAIDKLGTAIKPQLTWTSSNKKVATVDKKGKVKAKKAGKAKITAKAANGKKVVVTITVK
jgi:uncharacterized protein YjdB